MRYDSIQKRLLIYILSITSLFLVGISVMNYWWAQKVAVDLSEKRAAAMADAAAARMEGYLLQKGQNAWTLAQNEQIHSFVQKVSTSNVNLAEDEDYREMMTSFQRIVSLNPDIRFVYVGVEKTQRLYANLEFKYPPGYKVSARPWYKAAVNSKTLVYSEPYICPLTGNYVVTASIPFYSNNGQLLGVAAVDISVEKLQDIVGGVYIFDSGYAFMLDSNGIVITHPDNKSAIKTIKQSRELKETTNRMLNGERGVEKVDINDNEEYIFYTPISKIGWSIGVVVPVDEVREPIHALGRMSLLTVLLGIIVISYLIILLTSRITKPINEFIGLMEKAGNGDYTVRAQVNSRDELEKLGNSLNKMLEKQQQLIRQVIKTAYNMGIAGHELAITMGEAKTNLPVVTSQLSDLLDKPIIENSIKNSKLLTEPQSMQEFMEKLITINHKNQALIVQIEELKRILDTSEQEELSIKIPTLDKFKIDFQQTSRQLIDVSRLSEELQMDFVDVLISVDKITRNVTDIINTIQIVNDQIDNISVIQADSLERAGSTSMKLLGWSKSLLELTSHYNIGDNNTDETLNDKF